MGGPVARGRTVLVRRAAAVVGMVAILATGCSSTDDSSSDLPTIEPATPAAAPATTTDPAGTVRAFPAVDELITVPGSTVLAAWTTDEQLLLLDGAGAEPRGVDLPFEANTVDAGPDGTVLVLGSDELARVDVGSGEVTSQATLDGELVSAAVLADGHLLIGTADGTVWNIAPDPAGVDRPTTIDGLASADVVVTSGDAAAVLDRRQTSITELDLVDGRLGIALRAGTGASEMISDPFGRVMVTNTNGDELLVYTLDSLVLRQRYPVGPAPYAVTYDAARDLVWVTLTGSNEVVGYDLSTGIPRERHRFATVRQPNSVAVDPADGTLVVASATGDGLQRIPVEG
ncbi:YncE family protein [Rhodococcus yananensis]|uniref:YncE family protein n=1 Tax=Rhodococcus yananensis TaxID=2879464 RepID=UPI001CF89506|nr:PQQ-like beta-propeller repeat protein [Rhodococcus yananensis]